MSILIHLITFGFSIDILLIFWISSFWSKKEKKTLSFGKVNMKKDLQMVMIAVFIAFHKVMSLIRLLLIFSLPWNNFSPFIYHWYLYLIHDTRIPSYHLVIIWLSRMRNLLVQLYKIFFPIDKDRLMIFIDIWSYPCISWS